MNNENTFNQIWKFPNLKQNQIQEDSAQIDKSLIQVLWNQQIKYKCDKKEQNISNEGPLKLFHISLLIWEKLFFFFLTEWFITYTLSDFNKQVNMFIIKPIGIIKFSGYTCICMSIVWILAYNIYPY